jgi:hypothetical protein
LLSSSCYMLDHGESEGILIHCLYIHVGVHMKFLMLPIAK